MTVASSPSRMVGTFITMGASIPAWVTRHRVAMPPVWIFSPILKPSMVEPVWSGSRVIP